MTASAYRRDIDGLRAIAIGSVVLFHAAVPGVSGGFTGVDVFFVISGYLIGRILIDQIDAQRFRMSEFLVRRMRRLFPALFVVLLVSALFANQILLPRDLEDFGESLAATTAYVSNFLFFTEDGYFEGAAELKPLQHTWSLAVEEQFYLLLPPLLLLVFRWGVSRTTIVASLLLASFGLSIYQVNHNPQAAFYLIPARAWELLLGTLLVCLEARLVAKLTPSIATSLALIGLALVLFSFVGLGASTPFPGFAALPACLGTALLILTGHHSTNPIARLLATPPMVGLGLISYSLYLWHWPLLTFARHHELGELNAHVAWFVIAVSVVCAVLSWRYVERPFRLSPGETKATSRTLLGGFLAVSLAAIAWGLWLDQSEGWPGRLPDQAQQILSSDTRVSERRECVARIPDAATPDAYCSVGVTDTPPSFVVWGDSHAAGMMPEIDSIAKQQGIAGLSLTSFGCAPLLGVDRVKPDPKRPCKQVNGKVAELLESYSSLQHVILIARWVRHAEGSNYGFEGGPPIYLTDGNSSASTAGENLRLFDAALSSTVAQLQAWGKHVVVIAPVPEVGVRVPELLARQQWKGTTASRELSRSAVDAHQSATLKILRSLQGVTLLEPNEQLCNAATCVIVADGEPLYYDANHLSGLGVKQLQPLLRAAIPTDMEE